MCISELPYDEVIAYLSMLMQGTKLMECNEKTRIWEVFSMNYVRISANLCFGELIRLNTVLDGILGVGFLESPYTRREFDIGARLWEKDCYRWNNILKNESMRVPEISFARESGVEGL